MDALLINPWIYDFKAYDLWMKPLGLLYIGSILKKAGLKTSLIDCLDRAAYAEANLKDKKFGCGKYNYELIQKPEAYKNIPRNYKKFGISTNDFLKILKKLPRPKVILITSIMTYWYPGAFDAINTVKEIFPKIPVMLGGIYPTLCPEHSKNSNADYVFTRFSISSFLETLENILGKLPERKNFSKNILDYSPSFEYYKKLKYGVLLTSTGCPFKCTYCASKILQPCFFQQNPQKTIKEITGLAKKFKIKDFAFYDDAFLCNSKKHIEIILKEILKNNLRLNFHTPNGLHARYITQDLANLLFQSGFKTIKISLESADAAWQSESGSKVTNSHLEEAVYYLKKAGFKAKDLGVYVLLGFPGQKEKDILNSIEFVSNLKIMINLTQFSPIPQTQMGEKYFKDYLKEPLFHNNTYWLFNHPELSVEKIREIIILVKKLNENFKPLSCRFPICNHKN